MNRFHNKTDQPLTMIAVSLVNSIPPPPSYNMSQFQRQYLQQALELLSNTMADTPPPHHETLARINSNLLCRYTLREEQMRLVDALLNRMDTTATSTVSSFVIIGGTFFTARRLGKTTGIIFSAIAAALRFRKKIIIVACHLDAVGPTLQQLVNSCRVSQIKVVGGTANGILAIGYDDIEMEISVRDVTDNPHESDAIYLYDTQINLNMALAQARKICEDTERTVSYFI